MLVRAYDTLEPDLVLAVLPRLRRSNHQVMRSAQQAELQRRTEAIRRKLRDRTYQATDKRVLLREAESLLSTYHMEEIRYFIKAGVFAKPLRGAVKDYLFRRITNGDLTNDRTT